MKTPEEIVKENFKHLPIKDKIIRNFYKRVIVICLEEYGKEAYNQGVDEAVKMCAEEGITEQISYWDGSDFQKRNCVEIWEEGANVPSYLAVVDRQPILQVADKLKREIL